MMVKITNPKVLRYLRNNSQSNTELVEMPLFRHFGLEPRAFTECKSGRKKKINNLNALPIKIRDKRLERCLIECKLRTGAVHRHTVEAAILKEIGE